MAIIALLAVTQTPATVGSKELCILYGTSAYDFSDLYSSTDVTIHQPCTLARVHMGKGKMKTREHRRRKRGISFVGRPFYACSITSDIPLSNRLLTPEIKVDPSSVMHYETRVRTNALPVVHACSTFLHFKSLR